MKQSAPGDLTRGALLLRPVARAYISRAHTRTAFAGDYFLRGLLSTRRSPASARRAPALDPNAVQDFGRRLRAWYRRSARDLPWRRTRDAYRVLVSELMLQQTQVSRVVPKYHEFLKTFPSLAHVARATPDRVMEAWSGLGYYARARNLHRLAAHVTGDGTRRKATLPSEPEALRALPGIGAYTAGAVASFAYGKRAALVDTNVARVLARVFAPTLSPKRPGDLTVIWRIAERSLPRTGTATWTHNQALMELGALVCTARVAHCPRCPVRPVCATAAADDSRKSAQGV